MQERLHFNRVIFSLKFYGRRLSPVFFVSYQVHSELQGIGLYLRRMLGNLLQFLRLLKYHYKYKHNYMQNGVWVIKYPICNLPGEY